jgi:hypothetical protein
MQTIPKPHGNKQKLFAKLQEAKCKEVKRAFASSRYVRLVVVFVFFFFGLLCCSHYFIICFVFVLRHGGVFSLYRASYGEKMP